VPATQVSVELRFHVIDGLHSSQYGVGHVSAADRCSDVSSPLMMEDPIMQHPLLAAEPRMPCGQPPADLFSRERSSLRLEALGLMTAGIVHDLGNMIQILSSTVDVLDQHPTVKATNALQPAIDRAVNSLERARALIQQILSFARQNDGEQEQVDAWPGWSGYCAGSAGTTCGLAFTSTRMCRRSLAIGGTSKTPS
jgi:hypothetical protein